MLPWERGEDLWRAGPCWTVLFTCCDCGSDALHVVRSNPDEHVRCSHCEIGHVRNVADRLLRLALDDIAS